MKVNILTSGFTAGFTRDFADENTSLSFLDSEN